MLYPLCGADDAFPFHDDLDRRFLRGGLPPLYLSEIRDDRDYSEWIESFWARDILELFRLERRASFLTFIELLLARSGGRFEANSFASPCGVSRPTILNYLAVLEATLFVHVVRPFSARRSSEIIATPVVYAFDTGFVAWALGLHEITVKDRGIFWEHLVINELAARLQTRNILHWRNKKGREVDFVIAPRGKPSVAIEAKYSAEAFDPAGMMAMRELHPGGPNIVVASDIHTPYNRTFGSLKVRFCPLGSLAEEITTDASPGPVNTGQQAFHN